MEMFTETTHHIKLTDADLQQKFSNAPTSAQYAFRDMISDTAYNGQFFDLPISADELIQVELTANVRIIKRTDTITRND